MAVKSLQVFYLGSDCIDKGRLTYGVDENKIIETCFSCFLIRSDEGNILVDTGPHPDDVKKMNAIGFQIEVRPEDQLPQRLKEVGLSMDDINMVVVTHLDFDHIGWLAYLPNAEVIIQQEEYHFGFNPPSYIRSLCADRYNSPEIKWRLIDGDHILMPGLTLLYTPGHTPGHQSVMVDLPKFGAVILVGDAGPLQENFEKELIPGFRYDPRQALYSVKKLRVWSQVRKAPIFTTHDLDFYQQEMRKPPEAYT